MLASLVALGISVIISLLLGWLLTPLANRITRALVGDLELANAQQIYELFARRNLISE